MKVRLFSAAALTFVPCLGFALNEFTIADDNSTLKVTRDPPIYNFSAAGNPVRLPRVMEWNVDGRTILVYPSAPWNVVDIEHFHVDSHVGMNQIHAQGPMLGFATSHDNGTVTGGAVYTVDGGAPGSSSSRIVEKVDINNKTGADFTLHITGMGFKPAAHSSSLPSPPVPDYSSLEVTGTTAAFYQGNEAQYSLTETGLFPPSVVRPFVSFKGFNTLINQIFTIPKGAVLTMITELNVKPEVPFTIPIKPVNPFLPPQSILDAIVPAH